MNKLISTISILLFLAFFNAFNLAAKVSLPSIVSDGMVLQRQQELKVWGWAEPGEKVSIKFLKNKYSTITGADGKWNVQLKSLEAGGPYTMKINGDNEIVLNNILIGDVWVCSGQSNMELPMMSAGSTSLVNWIRL